MLTNRQLLILQTIIDEFVETARPIGSRALANDEAISLSAATIRNVMADLEDMGLLEKTHSSSGRIPSQKGYRYYVDNVITPNVNAEDILLVEHLLQDNLLEVEQVVQMSAEVLSQLTNYTTIVLGPNEIGAKLKQIQLITLNPQTAVAILITDAGHVEHKSFTFPSNILMNDLEKMVNILNDKLVGVPIIRLASALQSEVYDLMKKHIYNYEIMYDYIKSVIKYEETNKLFVSGETNILTQPEFKDVDKIYEFYTMLENEAEIMKLLENKHQGIHVSIGQENEVDAIKDFSLITATYALGKDQLGTIALLGPTRMQYQKVISLLQSFSTEMTDLLQLKNKEEE